MAQTIAVLIPGITGSILNINTSPTPVWPTQVALNPKNAAMLLSQPGITAGAPIRQLLKPVYGGLINYFKGQSYTYVRQNDPLPQTPGNVLVGFGYDWRQPNKSSAATLKSKLNDIANTYSGAQIWLIGHSMGGLVSRYLLESGMATGATWKVQGLITLGTPHLGAPLALSAITGQCDLSQLLDPDIIGQVVNLPNYPSAFELLPPPQVSFVADPSATARGIYQDPVNALLTASPTASPPGFGAPASSFADAKDFFAKLSYDTAPVDLPPYYLVYGNGLDTVNGFTYNPDGTGPLAQLSQNQPQGNSAGDGIVPMSSAAFTGSWVTKARIYNAGSLKHGQLPNDARVQQQITQWMNGSTSTMDVGPALEFAAID